MKLNRLSLSNFQGIKAAEFVFNGENKDVFGDNATGKTTLFNALTWLLFNKASTGINGYTPKTNDESGLHEHNLEHSSEAEFTLDNGQIIKFKKVYKEVYKKKRGSNTADFDGHTVDYYIDDVPTGTEKEYMSTILSLCNNDIEVLKNVTMLDYFANEISWTDRRKILLNICGDISDEEVIESNKELNGLKTILLKNGTTDQLHTVDEYKKIATAKKKDINKSLEGIPSRIDEVKRATPDVEGVNFTEIEIQIHNLHKDKKEFERERSRVLSSNTKDSTISTNISNLKADLAEKRVVHIKNQSELNEHTNRKLTENRNKQNQVTIDMSGVETCIEINTDRLNKLGTDRTNLVAEIKKLQNQNWDSSQEICPTCKQSLKVEEIEKLKEEFNLNKSNTLARLQAKGQAECSKDMIAEVEAELKSNEERLKTLKEELLKTKDLDIKLRESLVVEVPFETTDTYKSISKEIEELMAIYNGESSTNDVVTKEIDEKIASVTTEINNLQSIMLNKDIVRKNNARIEELEQEEVKLSQEYEKIEHGIYLCEMFIKSKVAMLSDKINSRFENVSFRLFVDQVNGGLKEDCEVMVRNEKGVLVPYANVNNAGKINAGLEIIEVLSSYYNVYMPVFVDNAESVTKLKEVSMQVIRLVVSEVDKTLRLVG